MQRSLSFAGTLLAILFLCTAAPAQQGEKRIAPLVVGFYNLEHLFDTIDQPDVDDKEFLPNGTNKWTGARYLQKLHNMARVINDIGTDVHPDGVAVLGVSEVENRGVLEDLVRTAPLDKRGYKVVS